MHNIPSLQAAQKRYESMGLKTELIKDAPGRIYPQHKHHTTYLFTLAGQVVVILDSKERHTLHPGDELVIKTDQLHEAVVGKDGWEYLAAWDPTEAEKYSDVQH